MDKDNYFKIYYSQYKLLEDKMIEVSEYVAIDPQNYSTFSSQFISLFISVCSEIDSLTRAYCNRILGISKNSGIIERINAIAQKYPNLRNMRVDTIYPLEKISLVPFTKVESKTSSWWTDYNSVKHNRAENDAESGRPNYTKANLKNTLQAIAALYIILLTISRESGDTEKINFESRLFTDDIHSA